MVEESVLLALILDKPLPFLILSFLIYKMEIKIITWQGVEVIDNYASSWHLVGGFLLPCTPSPCLSCTFHITDTVVEQGLGT